MKQDRIIFFFKAAWFLFAGYLTAGAQLVTNNLDFIANNIKLKAQK